jgi:ssDNA-binding Zn-finger/Zn-ribbon topoisomerase 1
MKDLAEFFLSQNALRKSDYAKKYEELLAEVGKVYNTPKEENPITKEKICPRCGNKLVLRTAKRGENVGNQFYGCSNYPKCRYVENCKDIEGRYF